MKVKDAIKQLKNLNPEDHIILSYWDKDFFPEVPIEKWPEASSIAEDKADWSMAHEQLELIVYREQLKDIEDNPEPIDDFHENR